MPCATPSRRITDERYMAERVYENSDGAGGLAVHDPDDVGGDGDMEIMERFIDSCHVADASVAFKLKEHVERLHDIETAAEKVIDLWENGSIEARFVFQTSLVSQTLQALSDALARERVHRMNAQSIVSGKPLA